MASLHPQDERNEEFIQFVRRELQTGIDGNGAKVEFISPTKTAEWWKKRSENRVARAINHNIHARAATIEKAYLNIFSILVYNSKTYLIREFISHGFQDQQLPLLDHKRFGGDLAMVRDMKDFCDTQWMFCPVVFSNAMPMDKRTLPCRQILPIKDQKITTTKQNHSKSTIRVPTVVFKEYLTCERDALWNSWIREYNAFVKIDSCDHIVQYLGSFEQNKRCFMVLEHAPEGSLLELYKRDKPPATPEERRYFLYGMMGLIKAVDKIQNLGGGPRNQRTGFAHRDIKPSNILVFPGTQGLYSDGFRMKLADFDTATSESPIDEDSVSLHDNDGDKTYCAPEASRVYTYQDTAIKLVPLSSDIWSLGCVFSEALVWVAGRMSAVYKAAGDRKTEIQTYYPLQVDASLGDCFHNSQTALQCVLESQQAAVESLKGPTNLSATVCALVKQKMLVPHKDRPTPSYLWHEFNSKYEYLFPSLNRANSAPTRSPSRAIGSEVASPVSMGKSQRGSFQYSQLPHLRTTSSLGKERPMIATSNHPQTDLSPLGFYTQVPFDHGMPVQQISPAAQHDGQIQEIPGSYHALELSNGSDASKVIKSTHSQIESPGYLHPTYTGPMNSPWKPRRSSKDQQTPSGQYENTTVEDVLRYRKIKAKKHLLPGYEQFCRNMGRRHFIFVIDDSASMQELKSEVLKAVQALIWLVKGIDLTCPEIRFTSKPSKRYPPTIAAMAGRLYSMDKLASLLRHWEKPDEADEECNMRYALDQIFADAGIVDPKKPTSVLIFTNGKWEGGPIQDPGVEGCITNVIGKMRKKSISNTGFTFQFVSFGDDQDGLDRMTYLDDCALFGGSLENRNDIVDHKRHTDSVWSILIGSVSTKNDESSQGPSTGRNSPC
ncbi:unnamed protein product [Fusarium graminearum]|uniref:Protein kinase domain-containing protein n=1 Tax=Gibberella zeae TaxID=5518 RepID=A0A4E9EA10_GIBZA|nr:unnamed protein product [Fusarium graminearum]CAF3489302.1 unnamed protein product [Fusarium graminearum]CAG1969705.1 unnamed protein product [Fusarium graminearum]CAG1976320.1 unnamed protein product [Fusarium graminearum]CAG1982806.1 unnamed protein product [Fusarium graminearum]